LELEAGLMERGTPAMAHRVGRGHGRGGSRELETDLRSSHRWATGSTRPSGTTGSTRPAASGLGRDRDLAAAAELPATRVVEDRPGAPLWPCVTETLRPWPVDQPLSASAPPMISISSLVMAAWRARLKSSVSLSIMSLALFVAASMAVMRAPCSDATDSSNAR